MYKFKAGSWQPIVIGIHDILICAWISVSQDTNIHTLSDFLLPVIFQPLLKTFSTTKQLCLCSANSDHGYYNVYAH